MCQTSDISPIYEDALGAANQTSKGKGKKALCQLDKADSRNKRRLEDAERQDLMLSVSSFPRCTEGSQADGVTAYGDENHFGWFKGLPCDEITQRYQNVLIPLCWNTIKKRKRVGGKMVFKSFAKEERGEVGYNLYRHPRWIGED